MGKFLVRRFINYVILAMIAASLAYLLAASALNPRSIYEGKNPPPSQASINASLNAINANPNTPILVRYQHWVGGLLHGTFGQEILGGSVGSDMARRIGVSLRLLLIATIIGAVVGVLIGANGAIKQYQLFDRVTTFVSIIILAAPVFVLAVALKIGAVDVNNAIHFKLFEYTGEYNPTTHGFGPLLVDRIKHLILPTLSLCLGSIASYSRIQRNTMLDVLGSDFLRTAQAKGLRRRRALFKHGLRTALIPLVTILSFNFGTLLVGATFTETIFAWHGMGEWFVTSVTNQDVNAVAAITLFAAALILLSAFASDLIYGALDPRVRVS